MGMIVSIRQSINDLPRRWKSLILASFDALMLVGIIWLSFQLRLGTTFQPTAFQWALILTAPLVATPIFLRLGLYRAVIRYLPDRAVWTILQAMALATLAWVFVIFIAEATRFAAMPRSIPVFYFLLGTMVIAGSRFAAKYLLWTPMRQTLPKTTMLIYGAGSAGSQLAIALRNNSAGFVAGFLDDDPRLHGRDVMGIRVYPPSTVGSLIKDLGVSEVILCIPSAGVTRRNAIVSELSGWPVKIRALPAIGEIASGKYLVGQLREIDIDDLLGRSSVPADPELIRTMIAGRVVMVTGAGGSIGSELCRLIAKWAPQKLVLFEANEFALYQIDRALSADSPFPIVPVLGSVGNDRLARLTIAAEAVEVIFHAAAHKHVPLVEANPFEGVRNNVFGTRIIATAALEGGVKDFVLISTDKAVRPSSVMGSSKRWAELIVRDIGERAAALGQGQRFSAVRFGNVLGSNGSVVPLFREQIASGGPVTVTDPRMTRYFMSIHEAAELIVEAGALSGGDDLFLLDMGQPMLIHDLAERMIRLAGLTVKSEANPDGDVPIVITGARRGEKLFEELFYDPANASKTRHPKVLRVPMGQTSHEWLDAALADLDAALADWDEEKLRARLFDFSFDAEPEVPAQVSPDAQAAS